MSNNRKVMSIEMYNFINDNLHKLKYNLEEGLVITPKGTNGTLCGSTGYLRAKVSGRLLQVHQILAVIYFGKQCVDMQINHVDGDKTNNRKNNLEAISQIENIKHSHKIGARTYKSGTHITSSKLCDKQVIEIRKKLNEGSSQAKLAKEYGISKGAIQDIKEEKTWKHLLDV